MALMGETGLLSVGPLCVVLMADGLLLSCLIVGGVGSTGSSLLTCLECFFAS
jgi:hypothetical protein